MKSDIEIAQSANPLPIQRVAENLGIPPLCVEAYGRTKAKINYPAPNPKSKLILVSAINPTPAGEGKTTVSVGLSDALCRLGKKACLTLREPSLGPVFGMKGGAAGGGYAQVIPMEEINLHFTGDMHAISTANNLLSALIDNHIFHGNEPLIDSERIVHKRCIDLNDRALRKTVVGSGIKDDARAEGFYITAASEVMAILCLAENLSDLKQRLGNILVAYDKKGNPVFARDLQAENAMTILLKDAIKPNLVQTLECTPAFIHGGPFANIAHGCNSVAATKTAMTFADYVVTEAGFGADLGGEKFLDIKCRAAGIAPSCVVIVATVRALKMHGGVSKNELTNPDAEAVLRGCENLKKHIENITLNFGLPAVVAINRFEKDSEKEISVILDVCKQLGISAEIADIFSRGGAGGLGLGEAVVRICENNPNPTVKYLYPLDAGVKEKITAICTKNYGASNVVFSPAACKDIEKINEMGFSALPIVIAKTQYSLSEDSSLVGRPQGFTINIREAQLRSGSGFIIAIAGDIMLMPGLPKTPAAAHMTIADDGTISGLS